MIDTSAWIEYFRGEQFTLADQVESLFLEDRVILCGVVEFEILSGARKEEVAALHSKFSELDYREFTRADHRRAAELWQNMRALGKTLKYADLLIAAFCIERDLALLTLDEDFRKVPKLERIVPNLP